MIFDAIVLAAVLLSAIIAFLRGFIRELLTIVGVVGGLAAAYFGGPILAPAMYGWLGVDKDAKDVGKFFDILPKDIAADACSYGVIFAVVVVVLTVLSHFLAAGAKAAGLGPVDRTLGVVFGVARAVLLISLLYLPISLLTKEKERDDWSIMTGSATRPFIEAGAKWIAAYLPKDAEKAVDDTTAKASEQMNETRERLEDMEVLKGAADKAGAAMDALKAETPGQDAPPAAAPENAPGYQPEQRQDLERLIENNQQP